MCFFFGIGLMKFKLSKLSAVLISVNLLVVTGSQAMAADAEAEFKKAMAARDNGNVAESIAIFEAILSQEPSLHRARLELAVAYYRVTQYEEARRQAQKVLDNPDTPISVRLGIVPGSD